MILTKVQYKFIKYFKENFFKTFTINILKKELKINSTSLIHNNIREFIDRDILIVKQYGRSCIYSLNLNNLIYKYFSLIDLEKTNKLPESIQKIIENVSDLTIQYDFTFGIFGSYANSTFTKKSDLDIFFIIDSNKNIKPHIDKIILKSLIEINYHIITKKDFYNMLINEEFNLGKEIEKKSIIINNNEAYYQIIKKAIKNGYQG